MIEPGTAFDPLEGNKSVHSPTAYEVTRAVFGNSHRNRVFTDLALAPNFDFLEIIGSPDHIRPEWLIPQFRHHALKARGDKVFEKEGQQQVLRPSFDGIRDSVRELVGKKMDALAREFAANHDMKVKEEIERLAKEYGKLKEQWVFVGK